jgi:pimeloyl-ACP methyl ester carboxylesterase
MTTPLQSLRYSAATATLLLTMFPTSAPAADLMLKTGTVKVDSDQIYFESVGVGEAVVLSHGAGGSHAVWYQQVVLLAQKYQVITWDHRGFGRTTDVNKQTSPERAVEDLKALLDHLGVTSAHLVGQSMGGYTVMGFALKYPTRVRSIVLADTPAGVVTPEVASWRKSAPRGVPPDQLPYRGSRWRLVSKEIDEGPLPRYTAAAVQRIRTRFSRLFVAWPTCAYCRTSRFAGESPMSSCQGAISEV